MKEAFDTVSQEPVAFKIFNKKTMSLFALNASRQEYSLMKQYEHPNILKARDFFEDTDNLVIVCDLMCSDVRSLLDELSHALEEN